MSSRIITSMKTNSDDFYFKKERTGESEFFLNKNLGFVFILVIILLLMCAKIVLKL